MPANTTTFTTIRTEGALLPPDLLQRIADGDASLGGLTADSYHLSGQKINEAINQSWNTLQGAWASFKTAQERLPEGDIGTTITRERWLLPLFRELEYGRLQSATATDFVIDGKNYPISHKSPEGAPIHLMGCGLDLDRRAPGVAGASTASPHSLVQVLLNRSDAHLWGFVSNGFRLRILRDNASLTRQAYVEFDLQAMMDGEVYSDFALLWLLCHQSRIENGRDCWLEGWVKAAREQGTRALDQLRDGVQAAIEALGLGFLDHLANIALRDKLESGALDKQDYYRQLLRLVYRLLFLFAAEDRGLLYDPATPETARQLYAQHYSTARLRRIAEKLKGTRHHDLFEALRLVMTLLSGDDSPRPQGEGQGVRASLLGLPVLGSFLFSEAAVPDIIGAKIANLHLLDAVRALAFRIDRAVGKLRPVDYKNLGAEELGSVYESLLELHPHINIASKTFSLGTAGGNERKTTGSYYTPTSLINALLDSALDPVIEAALKKPSPPKAPTPGPSPSWRGEKVREMATKAMRDIARDLRQRQTPAETILWEALRKNRLGGLGFRRQHPAGNTGYVVDFFCYTSHLIVELDGDIHQFQQKADAQRQSELESLGYRVLRFPNQRIVNDLENVLVEILTAAQEQVPPPEGEGFRVGADSAESRLLDLKICDPACGSGHFLIAAAHRIARALAQVRTGEEEPAPAATRAALRDVIGHCIYGVDINPMAVELCKVNLWMEALEPGKPLSFLDHRIQVGNSLLGTTPALMAGGIPDDAFNPIEGDDKADASRLKKLNRQERRDRHTGQRSLFELVEPPADYRAIAAAAQRLDDLPDDTLAAVRAKEQAYADLAGDPERQKAQILADAWCAAFVWDKSPNPSPPHDLGTRRAVSAGGGDILPMTDLLYRRLQDDPLADNLRPTRDYVGELARRYQFFHWHVAFPDVFHVDTRVLLPPRHEGEGGRGGEGWNGGFDCVLGNPPWERIKIQEKEWFAQRSPDIANAPNAAARKRMIDALKDDPAGSSLYRDFQADLRAAEGESHFVRVSGRYPLCGRGDVNTHTLFAESNLWILDYDGRCGAIIPTAIATSETTRFFFQHLMQERHIISLFSFYEVRRTFVGTDDRNPFCLLTLGKLDESDESLFMTDIMRIEDLADKSKLYILSTSEISLLNPNTMTLPTFRYKRDAEITKAIYRHLPILVQEGEIDVNPWNIAFSSMFHMSNDSGKFFEFGELQAIGGVLKGNHFIHGQDIYLPLYEAKMIFQFTHRWASYDTHGNIQDMPISELVSPNAYPFPHYWIKSTEIPSTYKWMIGFRAISKAANERSAIFCILPALGVGNSLPLIVSEEFSALAASAFVANASCYCFDFTARQKVAGANFNFFIIKQLPVIPPHTYTAELLDFIVPRVLELTYTAWDLQPFAQDVGYHGAPFIWDDERRFLMRCELDALYFHLYQISRDDADYIMDTFPIVRRKDIAATASPPRPEGEGDLGGEGYYRTKRVILEMYDQMAALPALSVPAPKGEGEYLVPDVSQWVTWLEPGPADAGVAHPAGE